MESLMTTYTAMWLIYCVSAAIGFYCYCSIPTGLTKAGYGRAIFKAIGLTVLFTPVPIDATSITLAPALVTVPFTTVQTGLSSLPYTLPWLASVFLASLIFTILTRSFGQATHHSESVKTETEQSINDRDSHELSERLGEKGIHSMATAAPPASRTGKTKNNKKERLDPTF